MFDDKAITEMVMTFVCVVFAAGCCFGFLLFIGIPWIWNLVKPFIHMITT